MAKHYRLHTDTPNLRHIEAIVEQLRRGAVVLYPTDTVYAIGCDISNKAGQERIRRVRSIPDSKPLTFVASSLSQISDFARISDDAYHVLRRLVPGTFTFLLPATKLVPKLVQNEKRTTTGIRVPDHPLCQLLVHELGNPLISMSAYLPDWEEPTTNDELFERFDALVDIIIEVEDADYRSPQGGNLSTMIDFTGEQPAIVREGLGIEFALRVV